MFAEADARGWSVVAPAPRAERRVHGGGGVANDGQAGAVHRHARPGRGHISGAMMCALVENSPVIFLGGQRARITTPGAPRSYPIRAAGRPFHAVGEVQQLDRISRPDRRDRQGGNPSLDVRHAGPSYIEFRRT